MSNYDNYEFECKPPEKNKPVKKIINSVKCNNCYRYGAYTEWLDGKEISVCAKHLRDQNPG